MKVQAKNSMTCPKQDCKNTINKPIQKNYLPLYTLHNKIYNNYELAVENDIYYHVYGNGITVIGLPEYHPLIRDHKEIISINWSMFGDRVTSISLSDEQCDKKEHQVQLSGKKKLGAPQVLPGSRICEIVCSDSSTYTIRSSLKGQLLEYNTELQKDFSKIHNPNEEFRYLAVMLVHESQLQIAQLTFAYSEEYHSTYQK